jgi:hypothetical protein
MRTTVAVILVIGRLPEKRREAVNYSYAELIPFKRRGVVETRRT